MSAHTPGTWRYYENSNYGGEIELGASNVTISVDRADRFTGELAISREEMNANGYLAAAAPDLLAACRLLLDSERSLGDLCTSGCRPGINQHSQGCAVAVADAAIAKAEGGR